MEDSDSLDGGDCSSSLNLVDDSNSPELIEDPNSLEVTEDFIWPRESEYSKSLEVIDESNSIKVIENSKSLEIEESDSLELVVECISLNIVDTDSFDMIEDPTLDIVETLNSLLDISDSLEVDGVSISIGEVDDSCSLVVIEDSESSGIVDIYNITLGVTEDSTLEGLNVFNWLEVVDDSLLLNMVE